jgi:hypothetical protein
LTLAIPIYLTVSPKGHREKEEKMKRLAKRTQKLSVLVSLVFVIFASSSMAADFFPLDVWEELTASEPDNAVTAYSEAMQRDMDNIEMAHMNFPFDVQKELDDLGGRQWDADSAYDSKNGATNSATSNPFGVPDELLIAEYSIGY